MLLEGDRATEAHSLFVVPGLPGLQQWTLDIPSKAMKSVSHLFLQFLRQRPWQSLPLLGRRAVRLADQSLVVSPEQ